MLTRFAPSPTGLMHLGNVRTALVCYLYAKKENGQMLLRMDDTDTGSCKAEYQDFIKRDLTWLGLHWDRLERQSERFERYNEVFQQLLNSGRIYKCYETAEELEVKRKILISRGMPPIYDRASLNKENIQRYEKEGRKVYFRFKINTKDTVSWTDEVRKQISFYGENLSDPVVARTNGFYTYMLPSVIDDIDYDVTHVVRGEDHIVNTAIQIQMMKSIGAKIPKFAHLSLLQISGSKLSKRDGSINVNSMREQGIEAMTINSYLANIGTSNPIVAYSNIKDLVEHFDISKFSSSSISFNLKEVEDLNEKVVRNLDFKIIYERLAIKELDESFWNAIKFNIKTINEIPDWWRICKTNIKPVIHDAYLIKKAYETLPEGKWNRGTWSKWMEKLKIATKKRGKDLFLPLRLALTSAETGPELAELFPLIDRELVMSRLSYHA